jgi:hypothetical protein
MLGQGWSFAMTTEEALEVCTDADTWADMDVIKLYHAAEILAREFRRVSYEAEMHCGVCYNSESHRDCWRHGQ